MMEQHFDSKDRTRLHKSQTVNSNSKAQCPGKVPSTRFTDDENQKRVVAFEKLGLHVQINWIAYGKPEKIHADFDETFIQSEYW